MYAIRSYYVDVVAELVGEGSLEPLLSGFYEPVLPALSREDRVEQIEHGPVEVLVEHAADAAPRQLDLARHAGRQEVAVDADRAELVDHDRDAAGVSYNFV